MKSLEFAMLKRIELLRMHALPQCFYLEPKLNPERFLLRKLVLSRVNPLVELFREPRLSLLIVERQVEFDA